MPKIIIVEDDPMISEIYQKKFMDSGFEVLAADSGDKVLKMAKKEKIDIILLDLIMPKMDGFEVLKNLRTGAYDKDIKVIIFSNLSQKEDKEKAASLGANGFIVKSDYNPSDLVKEVERIINLNDEEKKNEIIRQQNGENGAMNGNGLKDNGLNGNGGKKILLIEDEEIFVEMFGEKLKQDGFLVESAMNGAWGLKEALKKDFDFFIIDMMMPAMTGEEIVQKLKLENKTKDKPIIILSASVDSGAEERMLALGANAFFLKTKIIPSELSNKVSEILSNK